MYLGLIIALFILCTILTYRVRNLEVKMKTRLTEEDIKHMRLDVKSLAEKFDYVRVPKGGPFVSDWVYLTSSKDLYHAMKPLYALLAHLNLVWCQEPAREYLKKVKTR